MDNDMLKSLFARKKDGLNHSQMCGHSSDQAAAVANAQHKTKISLPDLHTVFVFGCLLIFGFGALILRSAYRQSLARVIGVGRQEGVTREEFAATMMEGVTEKEKLWEEEISAAKALISPRKS